MSCTRHHPCFVPLTETQVCLVDNLPESNAKAGQQDTYQVQIVKLGLVGIGQRSIYWDVYTIYSLLLFFDDVFNNVWVSGHGSKT